MIDPSEFRRVMGHFASGVAVVTTWGTDGKAYGLTASAVCSVSLKPTLLLVCIERTADSHDHIRAAGAFAINVLDATKGESLARRFAAWDEPDKFHGVAFRQERSGAPVLSDALAWADCEIREAITGGDHTIFLGEVAAADAQEGSPLLYYRGGYGRLIP
jgi:flavin reductase (DIM6/NTAB) family NADH-FMN oxidoreductase RutF